MPAWPSPPSQPNGPREHRHACRSRAQDTAQICSANDPFDGASSGPLSQRRLGRIRVPAYGPPRPDVDRLLAGAKIYFKRDSVHSIVSLGVWRRKMARFTAHRDRDRGRCKGLREFPPVVSRLRPQGVRGGGPLVGFVAAIFFSSLGTSAAATQKQEKVLQADAVVAGRFELIGPGGKTAASLRTNGDGRRIVVVLRRKGRSARLYLGIFRDRRAPPHAVRRARSGEGQPLS